MDHLREQLNERMPLNHRYATHWSGPYVPTSLCNSKIHAFLQFNSKEALWRRRAVQALIHPCVYTNASERMRVVCTPTSITCVAITNARATNISSLFFFYSSSNSSHCWRDIPWVPNLLELETMAQADTTGGKCCILRPCCPFCHTTDVLGRINVYMYK